MQLNDRNDFFMSILNVIRYFRVSIGVDIIVYLFMLVSITVDKSHLLRYDMSTAEPLNLQIFTESANRLLISVNNSVLMAKI